MNSNRRKMRKGTHSCSECRRRKVKCVFTAPDITSCLVCQQRGSRCTSQADYAAIPVSIDGLANEANTALLLKGHHVSPRALHGLSAPVNDKNAFPSPPSTVVFIQEVASEPWIAKQTIPRHGHEATDNMTTASISPELAAITQGLLRSLSCRSNISILSDRVGTISAMYYQSDYQSHSGKPIEAASTSTKTPSNLLQPEAHPTLLARQMLLFAGSLQHISPGEVIPGLSQHQHVTMKALAESAIKLVNFDDALLESLEGIENLIFEMFYHGDCGNIERAWTTARRAVTAAQMLGLHRAGHQHFLRISADSDLDPEVMWSTIVSMERLLSLLLGLPTSTGYSALPSQSTTSDSGLGRNLSSLIGGLAGNILERNATESADQAIKMTCQIDREIILAAEQMPATFWRPLAFAGLAKDSLEALGESRRAFGRMCYYSLVIQLHLPHMLSLHDTVQQSTSKIACANASRELLNREIELRTSKSISACCRMSDFMALVAGMTLMLGHVMSYGESAGDHSLAHQRLGDRAAVTRALACIDPMSELNGDGSMVRFAALLRALLDIEEDAACQYGLLAHPRESAKTRHCILITREPYLGSICISQEGVSPFSAVTLDQSQQMAEGVTIGGIGSMVLRRRASAEDDEQESHARNVTPQESATQKIAMPRYNVAPPFPAADFDDWRF